MNLLRNGTLNHPAQPEALRLISSVATVPVPSKLHHHPSAPGNFALLMIWEPVAAEVGMRYAL